MIKLEHVDFAYNTTPVIQDFSAGLRFGTVTTLLGANGCGKTTLIKLLTKNLQPQRGTITLDGVNINRITRRNFARMAAAVQQISHAPEDLTVERLVGYGRLPYCSIFRLRLDAENQRQVDRALALTDLTDLRDHPLGTLSGGQRQRAFIAMALAQNTRLLFLDEPTSALDVRYQVEVLQLLRRLNREQGITIIMVLHDINQAIQYSDEIIGLQNGRPVFQGAPETVITPESVRALYGIELPVVRQKGLLLVPAVGPTAQQ